MLGHDALSKKRDYVRERNFRILGYIQFQRACSSKHLSGNISNLGKRNLVRTIVVNRRAMINLCDLLHGGANMILLHSPAAGTTMRLCSSFSVGLGSLCAAILRAVMVHLQTSHEYTFNPLWSCTTRCVVKKLTSSPPICHPSDLHSRPSYARSANQALKSSQTSFRHLRKYSQDIDPIAYSQYSVDGSSHKHSL